MSGEGFQSALLAFARDCLEAVAQRRPLPVIPREWQDDVGASVFVTLRRGDELRGCIGDTTFTRPIAEAVAAMTKQAALADPRFHPVDSNETDHIHIEISQLTEPRVAKPHEIDMGVNGIIVDDGSRRGLLLPQVAREMECTAVDFIRLACDKAGIRRDAVVGRDFTLQIFEAEVFAE